MNKINVNINYLPIIQVKKPEIKTFETPESIDEGILNMIEILPIEVVMMNIMLPMSPSSILNLCASSPKVNEVCQLEYFWKVKTKKDFGENIELEKGDTWKNLYFNKLNPRRMLRQAIKDGDYDKVKKVVEENKNFLSEEKQEVDLIKELNIAIDLNKREIAEYLWYEMSSLGIDEKIQIFCKVLSKRGFENMERFLRTSILNSYPDVDQYAKMLECIIAKNKKEYVNTIYSKILNLVNFEDIQTKEDVKRVADPEKYARMALKRKNKDIAKSILTIYNLYKTKQQKLQTEK